jgi:hypothetical protein
MAQSTVDTLPGGSRSYICMLISVFCRESVLRWFEELLRAGLGRVEEDMSGYDAVYQGTASPIYTAWFGNHGITFVC